MKKTFVILSILISSVFSLYSQRVNERGLKCVSKIEMSGRQTSNQRYVFEYFDDLKLKSMSVYYGDKLYHTFTMNNGVLTRKSYYSPDSDCEWVYDMDVYGNVARITMTCLGTDGSGFKTEHTYTYAQSERHPWRNVIEDNEIEFARLSRAEPFSRNNNDWNRKFDYRDGIIWEVTYNYQHSDSDNDKSFGYAAKRFNFNVKNDTNIDFWQLWFPRTTNETIVALTEWLSLRPDYLMDFEGGYINYYYEYDNKGNLIRIAEKHGDYIMKEVNIKYLY